MNTRFTVTIDTDNAAFGDSDHERRSELALTLRRLAERIESTDATAGPTRDDNGNTIGRYRWADADDNAGTAVNPATPNVPAVDEGPASIIIRRTGHDIARIRVGVRGAYGVPQIAADVRGALADAYRAGKADARAHDRHEATSTLTVPSGNEEPLHLLLPDGRTLGLWAHHCPSCTSVDVWTERPGAAPPSYHFDGVMAERTGAPDRQPFGLFTLTGGRGFEMAGGADATAQTEKRNAQSTAVLVWNDPA